MKAPSWVRIPLPPPAFVPSEAPSLTVAMGVDGCRGGWCAVSIQLGTSSLTVSPPAVSSTFGEILDTGAEVICFDVPIGLLEGPGRRSCDAAARKLLGPRWPVVFDPPCRQTLGQTTHQAASSLNRAISGKGLAIQAYCISSKIQEVDCALRQDSAARERIREVHPELSFYALNGNQPIMSKKRRVHGRDERWRLLRNCFNQALPHSPTFRGVLPDGCGPDDYVDALVAAWTAVCIARTAARHVPEEPPLDARGLRMEMWFPAQ